MEEEDKLLANDASLSLNVSNTIKESVHNGKSPLMDALQHAIQTQDYVALIKTANLINEQLVQLRGSNGETLLHVSLAAKQDRALKYFIDRVQATATIIVGAN